MNGGRILIAIGAFLAVALAHNVAIVTDAPQNREVANLLRWVLAFSVVIFAGVAGALAYTVVRFRRRPGPRA